MPQQPQSFRDFGILPENLQPPVGPVRGFLSPTRVWGQYLGTVLVTLFGLAVVAFIVWAIPAPLSYVGCLATVAGFVVFIYLMVKDDYGAIELDGDELRATHLYTGRVWKRRVQEIERLTSIVHHGGTAEGAAIQALLGRIKGMEVRFRNSPAPLRILRSDPAMTNAQELLQAILYRMSQIDELDAEVVNTGGGPLVRTIFWKAEPPDLRPQKSYGVLVVLAILLLLFLGPIFAFMGVVSQEERDISLQQPHAISVADLIKNGPAGHRHLILTDFEPGGYVVEQTQGGTWKEVWVALFPAGGPHDEIKVVYSSKSISSEPALRQFFNQQRLIGGCTKTLRSSWGATLGPELVKSNQNAPLKAAWSVFEIRNPPTQEFINYVFITSYTAFGFVLLIAAIVFGKDLAAATR